MLGSIMAKIICVDPPSNLRTRELTIPYSLHTVCGKLNNSAPAPHTLLLIPRTCDCYLRWPKGLCRYE